MIRKILQTYGKFVTVAVFLVAGLFFSAQPAAAQSSSIADGVCKGILSAEGEAGSTADACFEDDDSSFGNLARRIIDIFSIVVGAVSVIMIIIGGFRYIISGGDSSGVSAAKNTILYAIVGLVIVLFAQVIIRFVFTNVNPATTSGSTTSNIQRN